jgi:hypothetical protein
MLRVWTVVLAFSLAGCGALPPQVAGPSAAPRGEAGSGLATDSGKAIEPCGPGIFRLPSSAAREAYLVARIPACPRRAVTWDVVRPALIQQTGPQAATVTSPNEGFFLVTATASCGCAWYTVHMPGEWVG